MTGFATTEMFGGPVDFKITETVKDGVFTMTVEGLMPKMELDKSGEFMRVWPPPRMELPVSDRDLRAMQLAGFI